MLLRRLMMQPKNLRYEELERIILGCGYIHDRTRGSHAIFVKADHPTLTIPIRSPVKSYLIRQVLAAIEDVLEDFEEAGSGHEKNA